MDHDHLFYPDYEPEFHSNQLDEIYRRWTAQHKDKLRCTDGSAKLVSIREGRTSVAALLLSEPLAEKIQKAFCIAHTYWTSPERIADEEKTRFENGAKTQSWEDELEHLIKLTKKEIRRAGGATRKQRDELKKLLEERMKCRKTQKWNQRQRQTHDDTVKLGNERWINAWFAVQQELDRVWVSAGRVNEYRHGQAHARSASVPRNREPRGRSRSRSMEHRNSYRNQRRETGSRSTNRRSRARGQGHTQRPHSASRSRSRSQSRNNRYKSRRRESNVHGYRQARSDRLSHERSRSRSQSRSLLSVQSLTDLILQDTARTRGRRHDRDRTSDHHQPRTRDRPYRVTIASPAHSAASGAELKRMAGSICDTGEITPGLLENIAKPAQNRRRTDGYRDGDIQATEPEVTPSASVVDYLEQSDGAVTIDGSVANMAGKAVSDIPPISRQTQDFQDGLRKLALQFDNGDMPSQNSIEPPEDCSYRPSGSKRKREDQDPSERKLQKVIMSRTSDSRSSTREPPAVEWAQEESSVQGVARKTPDSNRLSIRNFFKPDYKSGESLQMSTLDR